MTTVYRLKSRQDFQFVYENGKSLADRRLVLYYVSKPNQLSRVGFSAGKKLGKAVIRNRAKRLLREAFRNCYSEIRPGFDIILIGRKGTINVKEQVVERSLVELLEKAGLFL